MDTQASDLRFVWDTYIGNPKGQDSQMSAIFQRYWTNFAKTGSPNDAVFTSGGSIGADVEKMGTSQEQVQAPTFLPAWPRYTSKAGGYMQLDVPPRPSTKLGLKTCDFWDTLPRQDGYPT